MTHLPGLVVGGVNINNLGYANDTVSIATCTEDLQILMTQLHYVSKKFGMEIVMMAISKKTRSPSCEIRVGDETLKQIDYFKYQGCTISWDFRDDIEVTIRSAQAKAAFQQLRGILCINKLSFECRYRVLKRYVPD